MEMFNQKSRGSSQPSLYCLSPVCKFCTISYALGFIPKQMFQKMPLKSLLIFCRMGIHKSMLDSRHIHDSGLENMLGKHISASNFQIDIASE